MLCKAFVMVVFLNGYHSAKTAMAFTATSSHHISHLRQPITGSFRRNRNKHLSATSITEAYFSSMNTPMPSEVKSDPLIVCGPSGVGKGTIINKYMEEMGGSSNFGFSVSHTTRSPRPGEIDGVHYHFSTIEKMENDIRSGLFLEHAFVHGNIYGTSWQSIKDVQQGGKRCLLDIDVQGVKTLKELNDDDKWQPRYVFIAPPSLPILLERLKSRGTESTESLQIRTSKAKEELEYGLEEGNFDAIVVNDDLVQACAEFRNIIHNFYEM